MEEEVIEQQEAQTQVQETPVFNKSTFGEVAQQSLDFGNTTTETTPNALDRGSQNDWVGFYIAHY